MSVDYKSDNPQAVVYWPLNREIAMIAIISLIGCCSRLPFLRPSAVAVRSRIRHQNPNAFRRGRVYQYVAL